EADAEPLAETERARLAPLGRPVGEPEDAGEERHEDRDLPRLAEVVLDEALARRADDHRWNRGDHDEPGDALLRISNCACSHRAEPRGYEANEVVPEVRHDCDERAEVERDVEGLVELR